jgi:hypothetical protein
MRRPSLSFRDGPAVRPGELCRADVPIVPDIFQKDILQAESRFGIVLQGFERHSNRRAAAARRFTPSPQDLFTRFLSFALYDR